MCCVVFRFRVRVTAVFKFKVSGVFLQDYFWRKGREIESRIQGAVMSGTTIPFPPVFCGNIEPVVWRKCYCFASIIRLELWDMYQARAKLLKYPRFMYFA